MDKLNLSIPLNEWNELLAIVRETRDLLAKQAPPAEKMTPAQVMVHLKLSRSTYERYKEQGVIKFYPLERSNAKYEKGYYLRSEIEALVRDGMI